MKLKALRDITSYHVNVSRARTVVGSGRKKACCGEPVLVGFRGHTSSPASEDPASSQTPVFVRRKGTPDHTQDDTVVYQNKQRENSTKKPKRRGASFNLRSTSSRPTSWQPPVDKSSERIRVSQTAESSFDRSFGSHHVPGESHPRQQRLHAMKSTPSLQNYSPDDEQEMADLTATPPGLVPSSQSWHSMSGLVRAGQSSTGTAISDGWYQDQPASMKKSVSCSNAAGRGFGQYDNIGPQTFRKSYSENESWDSSSSRAHNVKHSYSASYSGQTSWQSLNSRQADQAKDYENIEAMAYKAAYSDSLSNTSADNGRYSGQQTSDKYYMNDSSRLSEMTEESRAIDRSYKGDSSNQRPASPPMPPVRDASSLNYGKPRSHEKYPSWPVTHTLASSGPSASNDVCGANTSNIRTSSWSDTSHSGQEFPNKPRMAYQPQLNTHAEERMSPQTMRRYFEENRTKTQKERFEERVATELKGEDLDIKKKFPLDKRGKIDVSNMRGTDLTYPLPKLDRDGRYMEDKNYAIPSPPQRDGSPVRSRDADRQSLLYQASGSHPDQQHSLSAGDRGGHNRESTPPPPLPDNSPSCPSQGLNGKRLSTGHTSPTSQSGSQYPCIMRAFYNTSTQTENAEVQVEDIPLQCGVRREEKSVQARPGSIVGHFEKHLLQLQNEHDSDYERLIFHRESNSSHSKIMKDAGSSPGPSSPLDGPEAPPMDHKEYRIPGTSHERNDGRGVNDASKRDAHSPVVLGPDFLAQIHEHSESETIMLRRLSQDFFRNQARLKVGHTNQSGYTQVPYTSSMNGLDKANHARQSSGSEAKQGTSLQASHARQSSYTGQSNIYTGLMQVNQRQHSPTDSEHGEENDKLVELTKPSQDASKYFDRNKSANMSLRKAYDIVDEISFSDKPKTFSKNARAVSSSEVPNYKGEDKKSSKKTRRSYDPGEMRETKIIAEKARRDWEKSGQFEGQGSGKLKRTTSEQLRPAKEKAREHEKQKHREVLNQPEARQKEGVLRRQNATEKPTTDVYPEYVHRLSDPKDAQKAQEFLSNSPLSRQRRMPSDTDNVFHLSQGGATGSGGYHLRQSSSNRSTSSCSSVDDQSRQSDTELRKLPSGLLLSSYCDKKAGLMTSSVNTSSHGADPGQKPSVSPNWYRAHSPPSSPKPKANGAKVLNISSRDNERSSSQDGSRISIEVKGPRQSSVTLDEEDIPSPPLLDTTKDLSPGKSGSTTFSYSDSLEYSPPPHPWKLDTEVPANQLKSLPGGGSTIQSQHSQSLGGNTGTRGRESHSDELSSSPLQQQTLSDYQNHSKVTHSSISSANISSASSGGQKYSYQITVNQNYSDHDEDEDKPPVLPPRNYRMNDKYKSRPLPEPRPSQESNVSSQKHVSHVTISQSCPPVPEPRTSQENGTPRHVSQVNVSFNCDADATPKPDSYADQLRQKALTISQSQGSLLSAARYQPRPLPEMKTNISTSRPVDKQPAPQEASYPPGARVGQSGEKHVEVPVQKDNSYASPSWEAGASHVDVTHNGREFTFSPVTVISSQTPPYSQSSPYSPGSQYSLNTSCSPSSNASGVFGTVDSLSPSVVKGASVSQSPSAGHSPSVSGASFDSTASSTSPKTPAPGGSHQMSAPSPAIDNHVEVIKATKTKPVVLEKKKKKKKEPKSSPPKPKRQQESYAEASTPPPPPPPKYTSPEQKIISKPLPPPPPLSDNEAECVESSANQKTPTSRYTSESYMYKRGSTRQGFGGNYRRSGETSPKPLSPEVSPVQPPFKQDSKDEQVSDSSDRKVKENSSPGQQLNKPYMDPPWGKRTFYPAASKTKSESPLGRSQEHVSSSGGEGQGESPSVKACIANFENLSPRQQRKHGQPQVTKSKVSELRDSLLQKSTENLAEFDRRREGDRDGGSLSSLSHSNESLDEKLSLTQSAENVSSPSCRNDQPNACQQHASGPSSHSDEALPSYGNHGPSADKDQRQEEAGTHRDEIILPPLPNAKPTSPTLESGYNSHNTPDNRSVVSELSTSSACSGSLSATSRNSSNVSKDSGEIPIIPQSVTVVHVRQKSMEEIECEQQVAQLVRRLPESEKKIISEVILPPPDHKTATDYMSGLFDTYVDTSYRPNARGNHSNQSSVDLNNKKNESSFDVATSSGHWSPPRGVHIQNNDKVMNAANDVGAQKAELIRHIENKLQILQSEKAELEKAVEENNNIGERISNLVETKAPSRHDYKKFKIYMDELDTVLKLLLKVSGQLARAENAVMSLPEGSDNKEMMALKAKCDDLSQKHEDAKQLKEVIDMRSQQVTSCLKQCLTAKEYTEYEYFIKMKSKLKLEQQELNDKISLSEEQLAALKKML